MEELIEKVNILKKELDKDSNIIKIKDLNNIIKDNTELLELISKYKITRNEEIKNKIISDPIYLEYKHYENEVNFIILKIRNELKNITNKENGCVRR